MNTRLLKGLSPTLKSPYGYRKGRSRLWQRCSLALASVALASLLAACNEESAAALLKKAQAHVAAGNHAAAQIELKRALQQPSKEQGAVRALLGQSLLATNQPAAAEVEFRKAMEAGVAPDSVAAGLARAVLQQGQPSKVLTEFASVRPAELGARVELLTWLAAAQAQTGDSDAALATLNEALRAMPGNEPALLVASRLKAAQGKVDEAVALVDEVLAKNPKSADAGVAKGYLLWLGRGDAKAALAAHRQVLQHTPSHVPALAEVVTLEFATGATAASREAFERLRKVAPAHPETAFFEAQFAYVDRQYTRSRSLLDDLLKAVPEHYRALELAAANEFQLGNLEQVDGFVSRAIKANPSLVLARQIGAHAQLRRGAPARAIDLLQPHLAGPGANPESLAIAGTAYAQLGQAAKADAAFKAADKLAGDSAKVRVMVAQAQLAQGRSELAIKQLQELASTDTSLRADLALVSAHTARNDHRLALASIEAMKKKAPDAPLPRLLAGQSQLALRNASGAREEFNAAHKLSPKYFPAVAALAAMDVVEGKTAAATERLLAFVKANPNHEQAYLMLADIPTEGDPQKAVEYLATATRVAPTNPKTHMALISRQLALGDRRAALSAAQAAAAALPNDRTIGEAVAQTQIVAGESRQAEATLRALISQHPKDAQLLMVLAEAELTGDNPDAAVRSLRKALELDPSLMAAERALAMIDARRKRFDEALQTARSVQKRAPKDPAGWLIEGDVQIERREFAAAAQAYKTALQSAPASETAVKLHAALYRAGQTAQADAWAAEWERRVPRDAVFQYHLGDVAMSKGDFAGAEARYRAVLQAQPNNALAMNNIAWLLMKQSKPGALAMAQKANALLPRRSPILDTLASALAASGKRDAAIAAQTAAVAATPGDPNLRLSLARYLVAGGKGDEARSQLEQLRAMGAKFDKQAEVEALLKRL